MLRIFSLVILSAGWCLGVFASIPARADGTEMELKGKGFGPPAFQSFCNHYASLCNTRSGAKVVQLTGEKRKQLQAVNMSVNSSIRQQSDMQTNGVDDVWTIPTKAGDCEDFAILKKRELMRRGWPAASLLLTVARLPFSNEGHVVLTARTSDGDLILDSRSNSVRDWSSTSYRYYARQSQTSAGWERIGRAIPVTTTAKVKLDYTTTASIK
ncbi:Predicted transglutaminase-like cysteine proteinase [Phyllobacterium sp. YR620]|uniref:Transglutaminase-like cysteine peptidase n=1 Tax=Phyllobacterium pellucidum TaxID=2740464 RepID=A0A849VMJ7_9HYPH|nr:MULTISPECIES: transglutaminase-like cysteine peptidase [Phyllobacterium]NTS31118.1 transglutaminase-like cysteine peptidase [Phyllobacterium pellucidum]UGY10288.1 transglutaminase-like cysteine peptidase [Phyllobacterium sp. T1018]SDP32142.1 Predicted transglutaminase-like cysteine proteinase [Phyllobacterium sp. YR620]SFI70120.1 Predicted transglutaminase-like cysteine proteinase [Phyllobacterium sp. CL33Tsu]